MDTLNEIDTTDKNTMKLTLSLLYLGEDFKDGRHWSGCV